MMFDLDDPFHYVLEQKISQVTSNKNNGNSIKLNLAKLPKDFFPQPVARKPNTYSQRLS